MRKLVAYELLSLDGVAEDPDEFILDFDDIMQANLDLVIASQDAVILGRRNYEEWANFWPLSDIEPFATFINSVQKYVVTSRSTPLAWSNSSALGANFIDDIVDLKQRDGGDIGLHGSIQLTQALLAHGVVDELRLVIAPVVRSRGRKLFNDDSALKLELVSSVATTSGALLVHYVVARQTDGPTTS